MPTAPTVDEFFAFAESLKGQRLRTAGGRASFTVTVIPKGLCYTVVSTGNDRPQKRERIALILKQYSRTKSLVGHDYKNLTVHAPYVIGILKLYLASQ